jgi:hypothetical protein
VQDEEWETGELMKPTTQGMIKQDNRKSVEMVEMILRFRARCVTRNWSVLCHSDLGSAGVVLIHWFSLPR